MKSNTKKSFTIIVIVYINKKITKSYFKKYKFRKKFKI